MDVVVGGGGTGNPSVEGVVAAGSPLVGNVTLKDSSDVPKEVSISTDMDGSYSIDTTGLKAPFILKAAGTISGVNQAFYSFASSPGIANINPITNLAVSLASGGTQPSIVYSSASAATLQNLQNNIGKSLDTVQKKFLALLTLYNATKTDPLTGPYIANHSGLDEVFDMVSFAIVNGNIVVKNDITGSVVLNCQISSFDSGVLTTTNFPAPQPHPVITPSFTSLAVNKSLTIDAEVIHSTTTGVIWNVVESNGGTITSKGVYTAPSMEGIYHIKATSTANPYWPTYATIKVVPGIVSVLVAPASASILTNASKSFSATVTGTGHTSVNWSVVEPGGGNITSSGVYTAPSQKGTYHIKAVSTVDPTKSDTATVTVSAPSTTPGSSVFPFGTWTNNRGASFTVTKAFPQSDGNIYYAGSITIPGFGTVPVSGSSNILLDTNMILRSSTEFIVHATIMTSSKSAFMDIIFPYSAYENTGLSSIDSMWGTFLLTTTNSEGFNESSPFARK